MAFTALQLINNAYDTSGIVALDLETPTGAQTSRGLKLLNAMLSFQGINGRVIPYFKTYTFNGVVGQETYFVENLISIETMTFDLNSVRFSMVEQERIRYFGWPRANNINSLPLTYHLERTKGGANIRVYFFPNQTYPFNLIGKFGLTDVTNQTDLSAIYDEFYIDYLTYKLAQRICGSYTIQFTAENEQILNEYEQTLRDLSPLDFSMKKVSTLQKRTGYSYADANLGRGWEPA